MGISFCLFHQKTALKNSYRYNSSWEDDQRLAWCRSKPIKTILQLKKLGLDPPLGLVITNIYPDSPAYLSGTVTW